MLKTWLKHNVFYLILLMLVIGSSYERVLNNFKISDTRVKNYTMITIEDSPHIFNWPIANQNSILFFWMTTCAPCKLDMARLKNSVETNKIPAKNIYAINPFEDTKTIQKFLKKNAYPFMFVEASELAHDFKVNSTPTIVLIKNDLVLSVSSGISFIGIFRAERLFQ